MASSEICQVHSTATNPLSHLPRPNRNNNEKHAQRNILTVKERLTGTAGQPLFPYPLPAALNFASNLCYLCNLCFLCKRPPRFPLPPIASRAASKICFSSALQRPLLSHLSHAAHCLPGGLKNLFRLSASAPRFVTAKAAGCYRLPPINPMPSMPG